jgi:hypothetical protein
MPEKLPDFPERLAAYTDLRVSPGVAGKKPSER